VTSYLLISKNPSSIKEAVKAICERYGIHMLDQNSITKPSETKNDTSRKMSKSIGIEDIKKIRQQIFLKPFKSKIKAIIIEDGESLTLEAQNALLKILEEPPEHTIIVIAAKNKDAILPTIQSRCTIREFDVVKENISDEILKLATTLHALSANEALVLAESLDRKKEQLPDKLEKIIIALHDNLIEADPVNQVHTARKIRALQKAHTIVTTTNANSRLALEATLLSFIKNT
jgi:DNA polymerase III gamma/tau subunit